MVSLVGDTLVSLGKIFFYTRKTRTEGEENHDAMAEMIGKPCALADRKKSSGFENPEDRITSLCGNIIFRVIPG